MTGYSAKVEIYLVLADGTRLDVGAIGPTFARLRGEHGLELPPYTPVETLLIIDGHEQRRKVVLVDGLKPDQSRVEFANIAEGW